MDDDIALPTGTYLDGAASEVLYARIAELEAELARVTGLGKALAGCLVDAESQLQAYCVEISGEDYNCPAANDAFAAWSARND